MADFNPILIVAYSGRMLAQCAKEAGLSSLVIDCFDDQDTNFLTLDSVQVDSLAFDALSTVCADLNKKYKIKYVVYGSGLEKHTKSLEYLHRQYEVLGNSLAIFLAVQQKVSFFSLLRQLHIPYPPVLFKAPKTTDEWLIKPMQGEGGAGIRRYDRAYYALADAHYWQKWVAGRAMSVLFVADGKQGFIYGFHQQQTLAIGKDEFIFSAISRQPDISEKTLKTVRLWLKQLILALGIKGINTLDFMLNDRGCQLLEINARPSASMQLYSENLLIDHINCFLYGTFKQPLTVKVYRGYKIIFAESAIRIKVAIQWPQWVRDKPASGSIIHTGSPVCSIIADGKNEQQLEDNLFFRQQIIHTLLTSGKIQCSM